MLTIPAAKSHSMDSSNKFAVLQNILEIVNITVIFSQRICMKLTL